jgi:hypothetical protein
LFCDGWLGLVGPGLGVVWLTATMTVYSDKPKEEAIVRIVARISFLRLQLFAAEPLVQNGARELWVPRLAGIPGNATARLTFKRESGERRQHGL